MQLSTMRTAAGLSATLLASVAQGQYVPYITYDASNFFEEFAFFSGPDPTNGFVEYVDSATAFAEGLAATEGSAFYMGVDTVTTNPANGRKSVRMESNEAFTHGLFIIDIAHMPGSVCGTWPAFWMFGPDWPTSGEIDIIEGVNNQETNHVALHTSEGCIITNEGTIDTTTLLDPDCGVGEDNAGCGQSTGNNQNYGDGMNDIGGGMWATEWTSDYIAVWHFPPTGIPEDIVNGAPDPSLWGPAAARFNGGAGCNIDSFFQNNNLIFDTTFCGDWAGNVWSTNPECSALAPTCIDFVSNNPTAFEESYWTVNNIQVYQLAAGSGFNVTSRGY